MLVYERINKIVTTALQDGFVFFGKKTNAFLSKLE